MEVLERWGKILLLVGGVLAVLGVTLWLLSRLGLDRMPGDLVLRGKNVTVYVPLGVMLLVSVVATLILNLFLRRR
ncbi:MAG: DUF2905 domain-containing protein [Actinobacteria bacterium]|nr:DUF2905 domain-containing protein [Actinomycetota bacterium]